MNELEEIYNLLTTSQDVTAINADRVFNMEAIQEDMPTYIVYEVDRIPVRTKDGIAGWKLTLGTTIYTKSNTTGNSLTLAVVNALENHSGEKIKEIQVQGIAPDKDVENDIYINIIQSELIIKS